MNESTLLSAGIDIGTTTTQLVISRISLKNRMPGSQIPKIEIAEKTIIYRSRIHRTPIKQNAWVDAEALKALLKEEYRLAGLDFGQIDTGAVIITGETAKKENAERIVHMMAELAGDFVVAVAGPDVESVLAGKGSGAMGLSRRIHGRIINLDVGGGTTNIAVFNDGKLEDTACLNVGGRVVAVNPENGRLIYAEPFAEKVAKARGVSFEKGQTAYEDFCSEMVRAVDACVFHEGLPQGLEPLLMTPGLNPTHRQHRLNTNAPLYDGVMFSGGVAEIIYGSGVDPNPYRFGDIGPLLGKAFRNSRLVKAYPLLEPQEKIRATVIGAGSYSLEVSGSTIHIRWDQLPVKNVPVARVDFGPGDLESPLLQEKIKSALGRYGRALGSGAVGLSVGLEKYPSYGQIQQLSHALVQAWDGYDARRCPLIILLEQDFGKVLGQTLQNLTERRGSFASIDAVVIRDGEYIDIGKPVMGGDAVPLVVKTLIFQAEGAPFETDC